jgi:NADH-ubiquinone oxidoreductase chain 2
LFNGLIYCNLNNLIFIFFLFLLSFFIIILTSFYPSEVAKTSESLNKNIQDIHLFKEFDFKELLQTKREHYKLIEYPLITQFILIGGITLLSSNDLITIFLSIELQSYGLYIISTIYRNSESSTSAGLTYFLLGGLSSCIILLGLSFLYINSGTTSLDGLYLIHNIITSDENLLSYFLNTHEEMFSSISSYLPIFTLNFYQYTIQFALIILSVGFLFKISAAPFHS